MKLTQTGADLVEDEEEESPQVVSETAVESPRSSAPNKATEPEAPAPNKATEAVSEPSEAPNAPNKPTEIDPKVRARAASEARRGVPQAGTPLLIQ
jgi:hypothetical protein